jgi:hypothetical protein
MFVQDDYSINTNIPLKDTIKDREDRKQKNAMNV